MQLPLEIPQELKKYESYLSEETFLHEIEKTERTFILFLHACEDETWTESNSTIIKSLLKWLTDATLQRNFPSDFFSPLIPTIHKHIHILNPWIPLNLRLETVSGDLDVNSLLLGHYSYYFRRRMTNECRGLKHPVLEVKELSLEVLRWINEFIMAGEIKDLWKFRPAEIWILIDSAEFISIYPLLEACESILTRYIERKMFVKSFKSSRKIFATFAKCLH